MDEKELKQYCRRAKKHLFCGAGERAQFEQYITQCARDFLGEHPQATFEDLEAALGTPEQAAASFMETLPPGTVEQYRKKRRIRLGIMTGGVVLAFLLMVGVLVYVWKKKQYDCGYCGNNHRIFGGRRALPNRPSVGIN